MLEQRNGRGIFRDIPGEITELAEKRQILKEQNKWKESDNLRDIIINHGYIIEDNPSGFSLKRSSGEKPADGLKKLILQSGQEWHHVIDNNNSKSYASLFLLQKNHNKKITPESIKPDNKLRPRFSKYERQSMNFLQIKMEELFSDGHIKNIKSAYKKLAKIHHPDVGGNEEKFKQLSDAHQQMLSWAENPQFTSRKALMGCWSYDGFTNKWSPPL